MGTPIKPGQVEGASSAPNTPEVTHAPLSAEQTPGGKPGAETTPQAATQAHSGTHEATGAEANPANHKTARQKIANLLWWSVPSNTNEEAKARTEEMLHAFAAEVRAEAAADVHRAELPKFPAGEDPELVAKTVRAVDVRLTAQGPEAPYGVAKDGAA